LAVTADGGFLIVDTANQTIRAVSASGVITRVAGTTAAAGSAGDEGPATSAELNVPLDVAATADGGFLIADAKNHVVRKVSADNVITRVAGTTETPGSSGDGGPATGATLCRPNGVAITADGGFLIADSGNHTIRKVSPDGTITRVAGTPRVAGDGGDGGPATEATFSRPIGVAETSDGGFLVGDAKNNVIRKVSPEGTITRVAGTPGVAGDSGDGGPATEATLSHPNGVAITADGGFLIADSGNHTVRKVSPDGAITRIADPGSETALHSPSGLAVNADGSILIAAPGSHLISQLTPLG
jgi:sugar lactone lactonase YvrE